jgi:hypothetical protein
MPSILIVEKLGSLKPLSIKSVSESDLYKKAGYKSAEGFKCQTTWNVELAGKKHSVSLYAKTTGRANYENKYEFPPPVDTTLYFGNCLLVNKDPDTDTVKDLTVELWESIYEHLFGGFEDIGEEDSEEEDEEDEDDEDAGLPRTKDGYVKDGFIVDEDEEEDYEEEEEDEEEPEEEEEEDDVPVINKRKSSRTPTKSAKSKENSKKQIKKAFELIPEIEKEEEFLDCTSELSEEEYMV